VPNPRTQAEITKMPKRILFDFLVAMVGSSFLDLNFHLSPKKKEQFKRDGEKRPQRENLNPL
jgi:hypothetical protein